MLTQPIEITTEITTVDPTCYNDTDGQFTSNINGGIGILNFTLQSDGNYITNHGKTLVV